MNRAKPVLLVLPVLAVGLVLSACAGGGERSVVASSPLHDPRGGDYLVSIESKGWSYNRVHERDQLVAIVDIPLRRADAWRYLKDAWSDVGLPEPSVDDRAYTMVVRSHPVRRRLGGEPLSTYLACGRSMTGPAADSHRIDLTVQTVLERVSENESRMHTRINALARPTEGTSTGSTECSSSGLLEARIAARMTELAAAAGR